MLLGGCAGSLPSAVPCPFTEPAVRVVRDPGALASAEGREAREDTPHTGGRLDVTGSLGAMVGSSGGPHSGAFAAALGARIIGRRGFGAAASYTSLTHIGSFSFSIDLGTGPPRSIPDSAPTLEGSAVDLAGLYRFRVANDDRVGLGIDLMAGLSVLNLTWREGSAGRVCTETYPTATCVDSSYVSPPRPFDDGVRVGPMAGIVLDVRVYVFLVGTSLSWRSGFTTHDAMTFFTADLHIGLGYWR